MFWFFWPQGMWDLGSPTKDRIHNFCPGRQSLDHWKTDCKIKKKKKSLSPTKLWISQQYRGIILFTSVFSKQGLVFECGSVPGSQQTSSNSSFQAVRRRQLRLHGLSRTRIAGVLDFPRLTWFSPRETVCSTPAFEKQDIFFKAWCRNGKGCNLSDIAWWGSPPSACQCSREGSYCELLAVNTHSSWLMGILAGQGNWTLIVCTTPPKIIYHQKHLV